MTVAKTNSREPKQARSRLSFENTVDAALLLMQERGNDDFTLQEVSARSGVSIGSIYARFEGKDELLQIAHARKMDDIDAVTDHLFASVVIDPEAGLEAAVQDAVDRTVLVLRQYADVLRPFMLRGRQDELVFRRGAASHRALSDHFAGVLRQWPGASCDDDQLQWCFEVVYSVVARRLGLGSTVEGKSTMEWAEISRRISVMVAAYLQ